MPSASASETSGRLADKISLVLIAVVMAHMVLAAGYAYLTPYRTAGYLFMQGPPHRVPDIGAPDERQHVNYVIHVASGRGFPVLVPGSPDLYETYQAHQPPLYYLLSTAWAATVARGDLTEAGPGVRLRLLNALVGGGTVLGVYFLCLWGFRRAQVAIGAAAIAALLPMFVALCGAVNNDPLLILLCTWTLALCAKTVREGWTSKLAIGIGLLIGLAILTKTTGVALFPALVVTTLITRAQKPWKLVAMALGISVLVALPWWVRNTQLYGDPLAIGAFNEAFVGSPQASAFIERVGAWNYWTRGVGWGTLASFFGVFGYWDIWLPERFYVALALSFFALTIGWVWSATTATWRDAKPVHWINGIFLLMVVVLFIRFNLQYFQAQARYILPALGPIAAGFSIGLLQISGRRWPIAFSVLCLVLLLLNFYVLLVLPTEFAFRINYQPPQ
jgi:4-amino-4-deoxy-L-arabinose transferase-like glycosyltransferase